METDTSTQLTKEGIKHVQDIVGSLLFYCQAVDPTLLAALSTIATLQANETTAVEESCHQLLDYMATPPKAGIHYKTCDMILAIHTSTLYLS